MTNKIDVQMFSSFIVRYQDKELTVNELKSNKLLKILVYLLSNSYPVSSDHLIDLVWLEDEINNPLNALKNLVYRLRKVIKDTLGINDLIITGKRFYSINKQYATNIDIILFEHINEILQEHKDEKLYNQLLSLYKGKYLNELSDSHMTITKNSFYHSVYIKRLKEYALILENKHEYKKMELIARKALIIDDVEEENYIILIKALYFQKMFLQALQACKTAIKILYNDLCVQPSKELEALYHSLINEYQSESIDDVMKNLNSTNDKQEVGLITFKQVYKICSKLDINNDVVSITIKNQKDNPLIDKLLHQVLQENDLYTRYDSKHYVLLLIDYNHLKLNNLINTLNNKLRHQSIIDIKIKKLPTSLTNLVGSI